MLNFSYASVFMAVFTSNLFIILLAIIFLNKSVLYKFGLSILSIFCVLIFLRMAFSFEFAGLSVTIKFPKVISKGIAYLLHLKISLFGHTYSLSKICTLIWGIVFFVLLLNYIRSIRKTYNFIQNFGIDSTDNYIPLVEQICTKKSLHQKISIIKLPMISVPSVFRYGIRYYILIPIDLELNEDEMRLVLSHELSHVIHHDLTLKFLIQILCHFYWWNLFCNLLKKQSDLLFELRVDSSVTAKGPREIQRYLACLLKVKEYSADKENKLPRSTTISLLPKRSSILHKRFCFLMESDTPKNKYLSGLLLLPVCIIYLVSFAIIFEAYYRLPENTYIGADLTTHNLYVVMNGKSTYDIYFNGVYAETVDSLDNFPKNCKIYLSLEEAQKNEEN